jgi:hypothetical protein
MGILGLLNIYYRTDPIRRGVLHLKEMIRDLPRSDFAVKECGCDALSSGRLHFPILDAHVTWYHMAGISGGCAL